MEIAVTDAGLMDLGNELSEFDEQLATYGSLFLGRQQGELLSVVFVNGAATGDRFRDEIRLARDSPAPLLLPGDGANRGNATSSNPLRLATFTTSLARAEPTASAVPDRVATKMLDVELPPAHLNAVHATVGTMLDNSDLSLGQPVLESKAFGPKQRIGPLLAAVPVGVFGSSLNKRVHQGPV